MVHFSIEQTLHCADNALGTNDGPVDGIFRKIISHGDLDCTAFAVAAHISIALHCPVGSSDHSQQFERFVVEQPFDNEVTVAMEVGYMSVRDIKSVHRGSDAASRVLSRL